MPHIKTEVKSFARIQVIGVGGSGKNATNHMINAKVKGVDFLVINTDSQDLENSLAERKIHIGKNLTKGLGAGMNPEVGKNAAEETKAEVQEALKNADMVFVSGGFGGGTCTGAGPVIAKVAKEMGALTIGVVTKPFMFEGQMRMRLAEEGLAELSKSVDALIVIPNDKLLGAISKDTTAKDAFAMSDEVLKQAVEGISQLITTPGQVGNIDFADIRAVLENAGTALIGIGTASGENRAIEAAKSAISSPLIDTSIHGAKGVLFSIAGSDDLTMFEIAEAARVITESVDPDAKIIFGTIKDDKLKKNELQITVIAANFPDKLTALRNIQRERDNLIENSLQNNSYSNSNSSNIDNLNQNSNQEVKSRDIENNNSSNSTGKIFNSISGIFGKEENKNDKNNQNTADIIDENTNIMKPAPDNEEDDWNAVPAFLRRSKK